jgi:phage terminase small subunit
MPRRSADFFATLPHATPSAPIPRLKPPETMSEPARKVFVDLVLGSRADQFRQTDLPLLVRYCEASATAERAEGEIAKRPVINGKASPWIGILGQATKVMSALSMRLRLSPQARAPNNPTRRTAPLSYYERSALEQQMFRDEDSTQ